MTFFQNPGCITYMNFLGISRTDFDSHNDSCPSNICPNDICPYQEYLGCYWPDFDETLKVASWEHLEQILIKSDIALVNSNQTRSLTLAQPSLFMFVVVFVFVAKLNNILIGTRYGYFNNGGCKLAALQKVSTCRTRFSVFFYLDYANSN